MPDISMCLGGDCPSADRCYRHVAAPDEHRQSYSDFNACRADGADRCDNFMKVWDKTSVTEQTHVHSDPQDDAY